MIQQIYPSTQHAFQYELNKDMHFAAAHYVPSESAGECSKMHGHTYFANVTIAGNKLDESGFLANFSQIKQLIHTRFDHSVLNEHSELFNDQDPNRFPTTENVARVLFEIIQEYLDGTANKPRCVQIFLRETPTSYVVFRPGAGGMPDA
ncbi:6-carboxytetrahydropterin synthase [Paenibacillus eucommiae]|uniref:6-carboxy-5,6,7,8-tetrahydropterin synthase n=1 Tax=Paenibacillus eucommiae TaxID=1355755 RepID=A0ABS4J8R3_9BACL|nr:6-pyruvoyl tetrahydropterin synthase family protein [Paenibacillus eucommiae]MBP1996231.1 6-pyruvoyltetrahydropterin/6-carboxytetrahydropterin synthase [Paenibacillus eucommiae]